MYVQVVQTWEDDVTIMDGCVLNLAQLLRDEGILF